MSPDGRALTVKTIAACERQMGEWRTLRASALEAGDTETAEIARQAIDLLLDLHAVLTEHTQAVSA